MKPGNESRPGTREDLSPLMVGVVRKTSSPEAAPNWDPVIAEVQKVGRGEALITSDADLARGSDVCLHLYDRAKDKWEHHWAHVAEAKLLFLARQRLMAHSFWRRYYPGVSIT